MTRRYFEAIAKALSEVDDPGRPNADDYYCGWLDSCKAVADACASFNPSFDKKRFLGACGHPGDEG